MLPRRPCTTTLSAAASTATAPTSTGWCRISRRCCRTMRSSFDLMLTLDLAATPVATSPGQTAVRNAETIGWLTREMMVQRCVRPPASMPIPKAKRANTISGAKPEIDAALMGTFIQKFKGAYGVTRDGNFQGQATFSSASGTNAPYPQPEADEALLGEAARIAARSAFEARAGSDARRQGPGRHQRHGFAITALINAGSCAEDRRLNGRQAAIKFTRLRFCREGARRRRLPSLRIPGSTTGNAATPGFADDYDAAWRARRWRSGKPPAMQRFLDYRPSAGFIPSTRISGTRRIRWRLFTLQQPATTTWR